MLNHIVIMGRLARDPELRRTQTGTPVASFRLAVERDFKDKASGERITDWIDGLELYGGVCLQVFYQGPDGCGVGASANSGVD